MVPSLTSYGSSTLTSGGSSKVPSLTSDGSSTLTSGGSSMVPSEPLLHVTSSIEGIETEMNFVTSCLARSVHFDHYNLKTPANL